MQSVHAGTKSPPGSLATRVMFAADSWAGSDGACTCKGAPLSWTLQECHLNRHDEEASQPASQCYLQCTIRAFGQSCHVTDMTAASPFLHRQAKVGMRPTRMGQLMGRKERREKWYTRSIMSSYGLTQEMKPINGLSKVRWSHLD